MKNIKFVNETSDMTFNPKSRIDSFYQICQFRKKGSRVYETRKIFFNEKGEILRVYEKEYSSKVLKNFMDTNSTNRYKIYPVSSLSLIGLPNQSEMTILQSPLTN
jgi:hypothetical protein